MTKINPSAPPDPATAVNGAASTRHTITISFSDQYESLYQELVRAAEEDERPLSQYVLRFLRDNHGAGKQQ